jgi:hypothetical protein
VTADSTKWTRAVERFGRIDTLTLCLCHSAQQLGHLLGLLDLGSRQQHEELVSTEPVGA